MKPKKSKATQIEELQRQLLESKASHAFVYGAATSVIHKASTQHMMGSGVVLTLTALGGREICLPVMMRDGLSEETIEALKKDLERSYQLATMWQPVGSKP